MRWCHDLLIEHPAVVMVLTWLARHALDQFNWQEYASSILSLTKLFTIRCTIIISYMVSESSLL